MATNLFTKIAQDGKLAGINMSNIRDAQSWFKSQAMKLKGVDANALMRSDPHRFVKTKTINASAIGAMLMFFYDPKTKDKLPYFDRFPLIFAIQTYDDGFLGMNLHYISPVQRAKLLNALYSTLHGPKTEQSKMDITYKILKGSSKFRLFKPCVKRYLYSHVKSRMFIVNPQEWDMTVLLPTERFDNAKGEAVLKSKVWADSMAKL